MNSIHISTIVLMLSLVIPSKYIPKFSIWMNYGVNTANATTHYPDNSHIRESKTKSWKYNKQFGFNLQTRIIESKLYLNTGVRITGKELNLEEHYWDENSGFSLIFANSNFEFPITASYIVAPNLHLDFGLSFNPKVNKGSATTSGMNRFQDSTNLELAVGYQRQRFLYELRYLQGITNYYNDETNAEMYYTQIMLSVGIRIFSFNR